MREILFLLHFVLLKWFTKEIHAEEMNITIPINILNGADDIITIPINILNGTDDIKFNEKSILRYGHHRTHKCLNFTKTFLCVSTCLARGYDIASANEACSCTCYRDKVKRLYYGNGTSTKKLPTTTVPSAWAKLQQQQAGLEDGDLTDIADANYETLNSNESDTNLDNETKSNENNSREDSDNETYSGSGDDENGDTGSADGSSGETGSADGASGETGSADGASGETGSADGASGETESEDGANGEAGSGTGNGDDVSSSENPNTENSTTTTGEVNDTITVATAEEPVD